MSGAVHTDHAWAMGAQLAPYWRTLITQLADEIDTLKADLKSATSSYRKAERVVELLHRAVAHDRDCEEEGEGSCCYRVWRDVLLASGDAKNVTDEEMDAQAAAVLRILRGAAE